MDWIGFGSYATQCVTYCFLQLFAGSGELSPVFVYFFYVSLLNSLKFNNETGYCNVKIM